MKVDVTVDIPKALLEKLSTSPNGIDRDNIVDMQLCNVQIWNELVNKFLMGEESNG